MKANRKFVNGEDDAVSPVIAVILMVAITVVLAATVYVWVSGFGAQSGTPAKTMSLSSAGALSGTNNKTYSVASATSGMKWTDVTFTLDGTTMAYDTALSTGEFCVASTGTACDAALPTGVISAGQIITIYNTALSGKTFRVLDSQANSVILTLVVG